MQLKRLFCLWIVCCNIFILNLFSQHLQSDWITGQREILPDWVFSLQEKGTVVSSSDPCMALEDGRQRAVRRALWLFTLQNQVKIRMLSDVFSAVESSANNVERSSNKILSLIMLSNRNNYCAYKIINEYHTLFGEVIVQIKFFDTDNYLASEDIKESLFSSQSEWMIIYLDDRFSKKEYKIIINTQVDDGFIDSFEIKGNWEHPVISSFFDGKHIVIPQKGCWYEESFLETDSIVSGNDLRNAFWAAYVTSMADQLFSYSFIKSNIQSVLDNYQGNVMYDLSREKAIGDISITSQVHGIKQNKLFVSWNITPVIENHK